MSNDEKRAEYLRRAEEAREAAKASADDRLKMVLYQIARLWERMGKAMKVVAIGSIPAASCALWMHAHGLARLFHV